MDEKRYDENKICFISCVNDEEQYNASLASWSALRVPKGMTVESVVIHGASSMTEGYQNGMESSDAKYKIYIHQDVWIHHKNFLVLMVREFQKHPEYGIMGVVGSRTLPLNGVWWKGEKIGAIRDQHTGRMEDYLYERSDKECTEAIALDGLILMTQYDVPWRTDLFDRWHFYDVSQCMEFLKRDYKVAVLPQRLPTCIHFAGQNAMKGYDEERGKFLREYLPFLRQMKLRRSSEAMEKGSVVIVIPIYKNALSPTEEISLRQLNRVLGNYPRVFAAPQSLVFDFGDLGNGVGIERFDDKWFQSVTSYSCLMMQTEFYERFLSYEYMLLYQTDAFVFSDRLREFCDMGYDYIGAPICRFAPEWRTVGARVGNGGFSLRRISSVITVLSRFEEITAQSPFLHIFILAEDVFFGYCGVRADIDFKVPSVETALDFAVQEDIHHVYHRMQNGWRPFGCHAWNEIRQDFWRPVIAACGYTVPEAHEEAELYIYPLVRQYIKDRSVMNLQPAWGWARRLENGRLQSFLQKMLLAYPEGHAAWDDRMRDLTYLWCIVMEAVARGDLSEGTNREPLLTAIYRAMTAKETPAYLWEMWDTMLPILSKEPYRVRDPMIQLIFSQKLEKFIRIEQTKIHVLEREKERMEENKYRIERQERLRAGEALFEKALQWNMPTETELWKRYGMKLMEL